MPITIPCSTKLFFRPLYCNLLFDWEADAAVNYGGIGAVIGHEITHGFDDQGSRFDKEGNLNEWWTNEDRERFQVLTSQLIKQFDAYFPLKTFPSMAPLPWEKT